MRTSWRSTIDDRARHQPCAGISVEGGPRLDRSARRGFTTGRRRKLKNALAYGVAFCLLLCGAASALAAAQDEAAAGEPMEISWLGLNATDIVDGNPVQQYIEEKFNVTFVNVVADKQELEQNTLRVASDEHPDAMFTWGPNRLEWYQKGAFRSIPRSMIDEHMPNYVKSMNDLGAGAWYYGLVPGATDEYYALPRRVDYQEGTAYLPVFRLDWMEKASHGITPSALNPDALEDLAPTSSPGTHMRWLDHFTWDQLETILHSLAREDLDGNGRKRHERNRRPRCNDPLERPGYRFLRIRGQRGSELPRDRRQHGYGRYVFAQQGSAQDVAAVVERRADRPGAADADGLGAARQQNRAGPYGHVHAQHVLWPQRRNGTRCRLVQPDRRAGTAPGCQDRGDADADLTVR